MSALQLKENSGVSAMMVGGPVILLCMIAVEVAIKGYFAWGDILIAALWILVGCMGLWLRRNPVFEINDRVLRMNYPLRRLEIPLSEVQHWTEAKNRQSITVLLKNGESKTVRFPLGYLEDVERSLDAQGVQKLPSAA